MLENTNKQGLTSSNKFIEVVSGDDQKLADDGPAEEEKEQKKLSQKNQAIEPNVFQVIQPDSVQMKKDINIKDSSDNSNRTSLPEASVSKLLSQK